MTTNATTPLDAAILARSEAGIALENAHRDLEWATRNLRAFSRGTGLQRAAERKREAEARLAAAVAAYDAAGVALDAAVAARPDLQVCTCGHPACGYAA